MINYFKKLFFPDINRKYPNTYIEELNYHCFKIVPFICVLIMFVWIPYIPVDRALHPEEPFIPYLRIIGSLTVSIAFLLHFLPYFQRKPIILVTIPGGIIFLLTAIITGLAKADPAYVGGFCVVIWFMMLLPIPILI